MNRLIGWIAVLMILTGVLAGCSQTSSTVTPETSKSEGEAWPRTIQDASENGVVLEKRPERIAVLHPLYLDYFFALDTTPIASTSAAEAMKEFATLQPYAGSAEIIDLGNDSANLEKIMEANPDVIVTFKGSVDTIYDELSKIAPVVLIDYTDTWEKTTMLCAQIVGKEELAEQLIQETQEMIASTKEQLSTLENKTFALLRVDGKSNFNAQGSKNTMYYNQTAGFGLLAPEGYPEGGESLTLEGLSSMNPDYIIIQHRIDVAEAAVKDKESSKVWKSLEAVKNNHVVIFDNSLNSASILAVRLASEYFVKLAEQ
ncbi:ABC transporter substrate-binding protein [Paenibacillus amylolyticus]|uniref:Iron chelate uptake transporter FeCT family ABC transporter periplasmic-binding protein n=1 Tax=Paenibacillus amylolyticus TaxID=1451 RepID=A0A100VL74_PAEAM|nr:ABC transporter substrate-binding protein [Paenibacillus amylolyticus]GAS81895.1 iron chelate uptake transporter FeCT family ABC transporter periplasmic-binding protein [Paenibacillus amylolyticus]